MRKLAIICAVFIAISLVCYLIISASIGSSHVAELPDVKEKSVKVIRVVVPDEWRGLMEFKADQAPTSAAAIEVVPDEHGMIHLPHPSPLESWHSIEVRNTSGVRIRRVDPTDPRSLAGSDVVAIVSGSIGSGNRVFLFICDAEKISEFEGAVRRAIGLPEEPATLQPGPV
jgi:hypothetical protein